MEYYNLILGKPDESKTYIDEVRNYEKNTSFKVRYSFYNPKPKASGSIDSVADKRYTFIDGLHNFVEMPDENFEPRVADQRIGYFNQLKIFKNFHQMYIELPRLYLSLCCDFAYPFS